MPTDAEVRAYFQTALTAFRQALRAVPAPEEHFYQLGDLVICLRFAGSALVPKLTPALHHLKIDPVSTIDFRIDAWDEASTGVGLIPPTTNPEDFIQRMEIKGYNTDAIQITYEIGGGILNMLDRKSSRALFWVKSADQVPYYESGAPLRSMLATWLQSRGYQYLHAAAVGTEEGAVILAGKGGSGKSTTALCCLHAGLFYLGDDYCVAKLTPEPTVYSLYNSGKIDPDTPLRFPQFAALIENVSHIKAEKTLLFLQTRFRDQLQLALPIKAILLPRISSQPEISIHQASAAEGLTALAPSTIFQLPGAGETAFRFIAEMVRQVPVYRLHLNSRLGGISSAIRNLLESINA